MVTTRRKSGTRPSLDPGPAGGLQAPRSWLKVLAYAVALFPPTGFLLGVIYYPQAEAEAARFGRNCMILAALGLVGLCFCWGASGIFKGLQAAGTSGAGNGYY